MGISNLVNGGKTAVKKAIERFPISIILSTIVALLTIYMIESSSMEWEDGISRVTTVLCLGIPVYLSIQVFLERINKEKDRVRYWYYGVAAILLLIYWKFIYVDITMVIITRHIGLILIFILFFLFIPYVKRDDNYEMYIIKVLGRFLLTGIYAFVLQIGISAILATLKYLLELNIKFELYTYSWLLIVGVFAPAFFLGGIPRKDEICNNDKYPKALKILMLYIVMPLITVYTIILYIYFGKIIITTNWPEGLVSHLVLWYGVISVGNLFLISDLRATNKWANFYSKVFPMAILPLMVMMFTSIGIRISDYGVTENRYYVVALGLWVIGTMIYLAIVNKKRFIVLPISLSIIIFLSICGPFSSYSISIRSQNKRFEEILKNKKMLVEGQIIKSSKELSQANKEDISSILHYFERNHSLKQVKYLPENFEFKKMESVFGFEDVESYGISANRYFYFGGEGSFTGVDIAGYNYMFQVASYSGSGARFGDGINVDYKQQERKIVLYKDGKEIYSKSMDEYAQKLIEKYGIDTSGKNIVENMIFEDENEEVKIKFIFRSMSGETNGSTDEILNVDCEFIVLVTLK